MIYSCSLVELLEIIVPIKECIPNKSMVNKISKYLNGELSINEKDEFLNSLVFDEELMQELVEFHKLLVYTDIVSREGDKKIAEEKLSALMELIKKNNWSNG